MLLTQGGRGIDTFRMDTGVERLHHAEIECLVKCAADCCTGASQEFDLKQDVRRKEMRDRLISWFDSSGRDLPWRRRHLPYEVWISEMMLQQTQVKTMLPYYHRWMDRFPDVFALARASEEEILRCWEGLGYYSRARYIHKTAQKLVQDCGGALPTEFSALVKLPGIGRYTAGAILSIAFNQNFPVVDGNVERIFARLFNLSSPVKERVAQQFIWKTAGELLPRGDARRFNQALMDLGATLCLPRRPECDRCPVRSFCLALREKVAHQRPVKGRRKATTPIEVAIGVLEHGGKVLIQKRPSSGLMANLWEFPGGKLANGETPEEALVREFREELELRVTCLRKIASIRHNYTSYRVSLHAFWCNLDASNQEMVLHGAVDARWVRREELEQYAFPAANRKLIRMLAVG